MTFESQQIWYPTMYEAEKVHKHSNIMKHRMQSLLLVAPRKQAGVLRRDAKPHVLLPSTLGQQKTLFHNLFPQPSLLLETACSLGILTQHKLWDGLPKLGTDHQIRQYFDREHKVKPCKLQFTPAGVTSDFTALNLPLFYMYVNYIATSSAKSSRHYLKTFWNR